LDKLALWATASSRDCTCSFAALYGLISLAGHLSSGMVLGNLAPFVFSRTCQIVCHLLLYYYFYSVVNISLYFTFSLVHVALIGFHL
jgi:uncharacterized MAPEG superfamily protein